MLHPLLRLVATQPQLLAEHAHAYGGLVGEELGKTASAWTLRALLAAVALALLAVAVVLAGVALMLWAVIPVANIQSPWALVVAPALPALVGLACAWVARRPTDDAFKDLKQQLAADLTLLREAGVA